MKKLKRILQIKDRDEREKQLLGLASNMGVSMTRYADAMTGRAEEHIIVERIQQAYLAEIAQRNWIIALIASIASVISAFVACLALLIRIK